MLVGAIPNLLLKKYRKLCDTKSVPVPITLSAGKPLNFHVKYVNGSTGSVTTKKMASGLAIANLGINSNQARII